VRSGGELRDWSWSGRGGLIHLGIPVLLGRLPRRDLYFCLFLFLSYRGRWRRIVLLESADQLRLDALCGQTS
jgi:hypothetical protein